MLVSLTRAGALTLLAVAGTVMPSACVRNDSTMFIRGCMAVPHETCLVTPSISAPMLLGGSLDPGYRLTYNCAALVENQMVARGDANKVRTETSRITVYEANVEVFGASATAYDGTFLFHYTVPVTGFIDPGSGTEPGFGAVAIPLTDPAAIEELSKSNKPQTIVAKVELHGKTLGGLEVHSNIFEYPIAITCATCSCVTPPGDEGGRGAASAPADCLMGQDQGVSCQLLSDNQLLADANGKLVCPNDA